MSSRQYSILLDSIESRIEIVFDKHALAPDCILVLWQYLRDEISAITDVILVDGEQLSLA